jgi:hypothetical protein
VNLGAVPVTEAVADAADLACGVEVPEIVGTVSSTAFVAGTVALGVEAPGIRGDISAAVLVAGAESAGAELVCSSGSAERAGSKATPRTQSEAPKRRRLKTEEASGMYGRKLSRFINEMNQNLLF